MIEMVKETTMRETFERAVELIDRMNTPEVIDSHLIGESTEYNKLAAQLDNCLAAIEANGEMEAFREYAGI